MQTMGDGMDRKCGSPGCMKFIQHFVQHLGQKAERTRRIEWRRRSIGYNTTIGFEEVVKWIHVRWNTDK